LLVQNAVVMTPSSGSEQFHPFAQKSGLFSEVRCERLYGRFTSLVTFVGFLLDLFDGRTGRTYLHTMNPFDSRMSVSSCF
jgi:hypothetical protein